MSGYIGYHEREAAKFSDLLGAVIVSIEGLSDGSDFVTFKTEDGREFVMQHTQDCCESVSVESVVGDVQDLIGSPILLAEEASSGETPEGFTHEYEPESQTWTFYKLATIKGYVDIRWFGSSNGYYSESVDFVLRKR